MPGDRLTVPAGLAGRWSHVLRDGAVDLTEGAADPAGLLGDAGLALLERDPGAR